MPSQPDIQFGTDGWRAIIGDDYTFANVRACAAAVARDLIAINHERRGVAVGYDTRFQSEEFARAAAEVIANYGIPVQISDRPLPTPALSYAVTTMNAAAGIMITASHNPPEYNGFKVKSEAGGSAPPEQVERIEAHLPEA
ncbi:MAG: phosphoglucomutase/phosphomannomutase family protein, partial [Chloroflexi bacterium]|nr:phosphoglucomutase/phosphomannomutase family protein [Chloroflexota bacterium]